MVLKSRFGRGGIYTDPRVAIPLFLLVIGYFVVDGLQSQREAELAEKQQAHIERQIDVLATGDPAAMRAHNQRLKARQLRLVQRARGDQPAGDASAAPVVPAAGGYDIEHVNPDGTAASTTNWALIAAVGTGGLLGGAGLLGAWTILRREDDDPVVADPEVAALVAQWERGELGPST